MIYEVKRCVGKHEYLWRNLSEVDKKKRAEAWNRVNGKNNNIGDI